MRPFFWLSGLPEAPQRDSKVTGSNYVGAIAPPHLIEVLRVLIGDAPLVGDVIDEEPRLPLVNFVGEDRIRHPIITLCQPRRTAIGKLICRIAHKVMLQTEGARAAKKIDSLVVEIQ